MRFMWMLRNGHVVIDTQPPAPAENGEVKIFAECPNRRPLS